MKKEIHEVRFTTPLGNTLQFFYNEANGLVVVDLIAKNEKGGNEIFRKSIIDERKLLGHV